ncbi:hypothetical protein [Methylorubrum suomiense]|uniref:Uncharacterized protein n=1 Tax=Methylorubrum suomiense TaxID=144191 RepID=A0ABQ4UMZ4_9HYPH|nr:MULTISPECIES: hypothetical protein [Methylobacteriaceae]GJE73696.1 hypothetical protein BGCPKDLD_0262 [Methylorubrum suomiense]
MLATWLAALTFLFALQCLAVVTLADRLTIQEPDLPARDAADPSENYARAA